MCGINGLISADAGAVATATVTSMNLALEHRGPDHGGVSSFGFGAVGMQRLAVVDLEHGVQPMHSADGRYILVYNGEIYNHTELRGQLQSSGAQFKTHHSDTEVVLAGIEHWGFDQLVKRLNGMFAFAVVDTREKIIRLARDRVGIKPLFYYLSPNGELSFSSELKSLLENRDIPRSLDRSSLASFLVDRYVADPHTFFKNVFQLPPGQSLTWRDGRLEQGVFADQRPQPQEMAATDAHSELDALLCETIGSQLVADVPVGVFLSGGIDSSLVAAYSARVGSGELHTFSMGFSEKSHDESHLAREVAAHIGSSHHEFNIPNQGYDAALLSKILNHTGQPLGDTSCIPMYYLSQETAKHVTVALSGDGGDEYFGGYDHIRWALAIRRLSQRMPAPVLGAANRLLGSAGAQAIGSRIARNAYRRAQKAVAVAALPDGEQLRSIMALWQPRETVGLLRNKEGEARLSHELISDQVTNADALEQIMWVLSRSYMPGAILPKVDRMSMSASLEVRVPLLDNRIIDFGLKLPGQYKFRQGIGKQILRELGASMLPESVFTHPKQGFAIPLANWFNAQFWSEMDAASKPGQVLDELFERDALTSIIEQAKQGAGSAAHVSGAAAAARVWVLAMISRWVEDFGVTIDD